MRLSPRGTPRRWSRGPPASRTWRSALRWPPSSSSQFGNVLRNVCSITGAPSAGSCSPTMTLTGTGVALHLGREVALGPGQQVVGEGLPRRGRHRVRDHLVDPGAGEPVAGGEVDDHRAVLVVLGGAGEQAPALVVERHARRGHRADADDPLDALRRLGQHALDGHAAHRVADEAERRPAQLVGEGEGVRGDLVHRVLAGLVDARTVPAVVREDVGEALAVEQLTPVPPAGGRTEPTGQTDDLAWPVADGHVRDRHVLS